MIDRDEVDDHEYLPENEQVIHVFLACSWDRALGQTGRAVWLGINGPEILSRCRLRRIKKRAWPEIEAGVRLMAGTAKPLLDEQRAKAETEDVERARAKARSGGKR